MGDCYLGSTLLCVKVLILTISKATRGMTCKNLIILSFVYRYYCYPSSGYQLLLLLARPVYVVLCWLLLSAGLTARFLPAVLYRWRLVLCWVCYASWRFAVCLCDVTSTSSLSMFLLMLWCLVRESATNDQRKLVRRQWEAASLGVFFFFIGYLLCKILDCFYSLIQ